MSRYFGDNSINYNNQDGKPDQLKNLIIIGSHARAENNPNTPIEGIFIEWNNQTNTFWITEVDSNGQPLVDANQNIVKYKLQNCTHPELILDAWSEHSHLAFLLKKAKEFLLSKQMIESTLAKLNKHKLEHLQIYTSGVCRFSGIEYTQHQVEDDSLVFLFGHNQFGPKYSLLRFIQITLLIEVIKLYSQEGVSGFFDISSIRFSIENKLNFLINFDRFSISETKKILYLYNKLNQIYHSRISGSKISIEEIESAISYWLKQ